MQNMQKHYHDLNINKPLDRRTVKEYMQQDIQASLFGLSVHKISLYG